VAQNIDKVEKGQQEKDAAIQAQARRKCPGADGG
jgi:hypothetical protein